jgi:hypothetical protein
MNGSLELTYNYGIGSYELGNDYEAIHIEHEEVYNHLKNKAEKGPENSLVVHDPDGHKFFIYHGTTEYPVKRVSLNVNFFHLMHFIHFYVFRSRTWLNQNNFGLILLERKK